jgi:hypothetical protein
MRILDLEWKRAGERARVSATVRWEDCNEPDREVFMETTGAFGTDLAANPHAFLVGCIVPAMHFGEKRISMDSPICPGLREGLETVMALMKQWSGGGYRPLAIEAETLNRVPPRLKTGRAGLFLSGGIDSLAALRLNTLHYPAGHPGLVRDCLFLHGFDIGGVMERGMKFHVFDRAFRSMSRIARDAGCSLIPVYTNIRHLCDERDLWLNKFFGAALAAVGHAFVPRLELVYIASSYDLYNLAPCGSHPLLDPEYSSFDLRIRHRDVALSRIDKLRIVAEWDPAFQNFRVCLANVEDRLNCGKCEKCVRTMTGLVALGALHKTRAFVEDDVTPDMFEGFKITIRHRESFYRGLIPLLKERGRDDLVRTIERKLRE